MSENTEKTVVTEKAAPAVEKKVPEKKAPEKKERIILDVAYQPQVRTNQDTAWIMRRVIYALLPALVWSVVQFGWNSLLLVCTSVAAAVFFEWGYRKLLKKSISIDDYSAALTGLLIGLSMPATAPWWVPVIGNLFAIVVVKLLYGGLGKNFLTPALAGHAFLLASYALIMGTYSVPAGLKGAVDGVTMATPLTYLYGENALPAYYSLKTMFVGTIPGANGEVSTLLLLLGGIYLIIRKIVPWRIPVSFLGTVAVLTLIFGGGDMGNFDFMLYNLCSGSVVLAAIYMATDYSTSPVTLNGQLLYGAGCGVLTVLIRYFGGYPEGSTYAVLIMNLCTWAIDKGFHRHQFGVTKEDLAAEKAAKKAAKEAAKA